MIVALFCLSVPLSAQADDAAVYRALAAKLMEARGDLSADAQTSTANQSGYQYGAVFPFVGNNGYWFTGLVLYDLSGATNNFMVGCYDADGYVVATGTFSLGANDTLADLLDNLVTDGTVSDQTSVGIFASGNFLASKFVGNLSGGYSEVQKEAELF